MKIFVLILRLQYQHIYVAPFWNVPYHPKFAAPNNQLSRYQSHKCVHIRRIYKLALTLKLWQKYFLTFLLLTMLPHNTWTMPLNLEHFIECPQWVPSCPV